MTRLYGRWAQVLLLVAVLAGSPWAVAQTDPLPSWNDGPAKKAIVDFVQATTTQGNPQFVPPAERITTFDQDGNSAGDKEMLEYTKAGEGSRLAMLVLHDDGTREYAYGPAKELRASKVGTFPQTPYDQIFSFDK